MYVVCKFHPVGQGIFSTGQITRSNGKFQWVYDCGTASSQHYLTQEIDKIRPRSNSPRPLFDLAVLSHFDKDHLSGFVRFLSFTQVTTLLLPYIPFEYRLILAAISRSKADSDLVQFLVDPVFFVSSRKEFKVSKILFVLGRNVPPNNVDSFNPNNNQPDLDGSLGESDEPKVADPNADENSSLITQYYVATRDELDPDEQIEFDWYKINSPEVEFLRPDSGLTIEGLWEFFPYNDFIPNKKVTQKFISSVKNARDKFLSAPSDTALKTLRNVYDKNFGKTGKMRNTISLFMYAGPLSQRPVLTFIPAPAKYRGVPPKAKVSTEAARLDGKGIIYTGDGYLKTDAQVVRFFGAIGTTRLAQSNFLQVMHHGSKNNSHPNIARLISPLGSIFCSNPDDGRYNHPHKSIVRQFADYNPLQVDLQNGLKIVIKFSG